MDLDQRGGVSVVGTGFSTQGTIDWLNLISKPISFSVEVLRRLSAANVDPYTLIVGQAIAQHFILGSRGRQNVRQALTQLRSYGSFGGAIWFGFGVQSFVRTLGRTDEGTSLLALAAALGECFHEDLAAEVLHSMARSHKVPESLTPSVLEWLAVVKACTGVFSATEFPILAEQFMSLAPYQRSMPIEDRALELRGMSRGSPPSDDVAEALKALCRVSRNELVSVRIQGGPACGWLGAVAVWLFNFSISISSKDRQLYSSLIPPGTEFQVHLIFEDDDRDNNHELEVMSNTYRLRSSGELFYWQADGTLWERTMGGKLDWATCLSSVFGNEFHELMRNVSDVGTAFGCAGRIFKALALGHSDYPPKITYQWRLLFDASSGLGFVQNALKCFPELDSARVHMDAGAKMDLCDARTHYERAVLNIRQICPCPICNIQHDESNVSAYCFVILLECILYLSLVLSGLSVSEGLCPTRVGIELFYKRQDDMYGANSIKPMSRVTSLYPGLIYHILDRRERSPRVSHQENRFEEALQLFTGRSHVSQYAFNSSPISARVESGICVYMDTLRELSVNKESVGRLHVVPGRIEHLGRPFNLVVDRSFPTESPIDLVSKKEGFTNVSLLCTERAHSLSVSFELRDEGAKSCVQIGPACLVNGVCLARGRVRCLKRGCATIFGVEELRQQTQKYVLNDKEIYLCGGDDSFKSAVVCSSIARGWSCILRSHECIQCCLRAVSTMGNDQPVFIVS